MAGEDLAVDGHAWAFEYLGPLIKEAIDVLRIDEGNLHGDGIQKRGQLFNRHVPARKDDFVAGADCFRRLTLFSLFPDFLSHTEADIVILNVVINSIPFFFREIHCADGE